MLRTMVKLAGSVETVVHATSLGPLVVQPVLLLGSLTVNANAEEARARRKATERIAGD